MNVDTLRTAYDQFAEAARGGFPPAPEGEWGPEMILAHIIVGDRLIAQTAADVLAGRPGRFDNRASQCEPYLRSVIDAAGDWDGLVGALRHTGRELIGVAERTTEEQAATVIHVLIVSGDEVIVDGPQPLGSLLHGPADVHLPLHAKQLAAPSAAGRA